MSIVEFNSSFWTDPDFADMPLIARALFIYFWTNDHKTTSCVYQLPLSTIKAETGLTAEEIAALILKLHPKAKYDYTSSVVWVPGHIKHQFMRTGKISPKIVISITKSLMLAPTGHPFIGELLEKYAFLNIQYPFPIKAAFAAGLPPASVKDDAPVLGNPPPEVPLAGASDISADITVDAAKGGWKGISEGELTEWKTKYTLLDVEDELRSLADWCINTKKGQRRYKEIKNKRVFLTRRMDDNQKKREIAGCPISGADLEAEARAEKESYAGTPQHILEALQAEVPK